MIIALLASLALAPVPDSGETLLRRMHAEHHDTWFRTLAFVQHTTYPGTDRPPETWYETMSRPGRLRIDIERNGAMVGRMVFRADSVYQAMGTAAPAVRPQIHYLLLLAHDIHVGSPDAVIAKLRGLGFDLSRTGAATWEGRSVIVIGAATGDTATRQFWVDPERLVVVRVLQPGPQGTVGDVRIGGFTREGAALLERTITFFTNGRPTMHEEYTWIRTGLPVSDALFDPAQAALPPWIEEYKRERRSP